MCLAIPGRIEKITGRKATVKYPGQIRDVLVGEESIKPGDYVLIQMGIVVKVLNPREAKKSIKAWESALV